MKAEKKLYVQTIQLKLPKKNDEEIISSCVVDVLPNNACTNKRL